MALEAIGYALSSEEHRPLDLVANAVRAEQAGFDFAMVSDHFHPWTDRQGQSPFVWAVIGGIAASTQRLRLGTGVTCPTVRIHPAIVAQAAATAASMLPPDRFFLGVGSGEALNEHILGDAWPGADVRQEMLEEAIEVIRTLWEGGSQSFDGAHFTVDHARIYTLPDQLPKILVAASGTHAAELAGRVGDGLISTSANADLVRTFEENGGHGKPRIVQFSVCVAESEARGRQIAHEYWPLAAIPGELSQELPLPRHFEQAASLVTEELVAEAVQCSLEPEAHVAKVREAVEAGFDHVYVHQIGPDQQRFFEFYQREVLPRLA